MIRVAHFLSRLKYPDKWSSLSKTAVDPKPDDGSTVWMTVEQAAAVLDKVHVLHWRPSAVYGFASGALSTAPAASGVFSGSSIALFWVTTEAEATGAWVTLRQADFWTPTFGASFCVIHATDGVTIDGIAARAEYGASGANSVDASLMVGRHLVIVVGDKSGSGLRFVLSVYAAVRTVVERAAISLFGECLRGAWHVC